MTLDEYLSQNDIRNSSFAALIGVSSEAVRRYRDGERIPRPKQMTAIEQATDGAVRANDFFNSRIPDREMSS